MLYVRRRQVLLSWAETRALSIEVELLTTWYYHGPPPFGSPHPLGQQKNSPPTKNPPTSPSWISANFEAIRKPKQANSRELIYLRNTCFVSKAARPQGACWQLR